MKEDLVRAHRLSCADLPFLTLKEIEITLKKRLTSVIGERRI